MAYGFSKDDGLEWINNVDVSQLSAEQQNAYEAYRTARKIAGEAKGKFEASMQTLAPRGQRLVFNYRFGGLSIAVADGQVKPKAEAKPKQSLTAFLAQQNGRNV